VNRTRRRAARTPRPVRRGRRVLIRFACPADRAEFRALAEASRRFLAPWEPRVHDPGSRLRFERLLAGRNDPHSRRFLVCRRADGTILGTFTIGNIVRGAAHSATLGTWVGAAHARQGYMREARGLVLAHAFGALKLHRVEVNLIRANRASRALARGAGFRREGIAKRFLRIAGRWQDCERWALLREEWRAGRRAARRRATR
jgi:[ribosomal protein S5]-alanine N-acetyltransferase